MKTKIDLTERFPMKFDVERMKQDIANLDQDRWLGHYDKGLSTGWKGIPLVSIGGELGNEEAQRPLPLDQYDRYQRTPILEDLPYFKEILDAFKCPEGRIRILRLMPGSGIAEHRDVGNEAACFACGQVRLHIPIETNDKVNFFVGGEKIHMRPGRLYYVNFTKRHWVRNDGDAPRLHLVLDLKVNDWMTDLFPPHSLFERAENWVCSKVWPVFWRLRWKKAKLIMAFWRKYNGSRLQRLRHSLRRSAA